MAEASIPPAAGSPPKKVLICRTDVLQLSETFIREQVLSYQRWQGKLVGFRRVPGLGLDGLDVRVLGSDHPGRATRLAERVCWRMDWGNPVWRAQLTREQASLVHVHFATDAVDFWPQVRHLPAPVIVTLHGYDITTYKSHWASGAGGLRRMRFAQRLLLMAASPRVHFVAVSEAIKQRAIEFGIPAQRIRVHYIGIDHAAFRSAGPPILERKRQILSIGRLVEKKGMSYLIEAYARVRQRVADAELVIVGDGPLRGELQALAARLRVPVNFVGAMGREGITQLLGESRIFCAASVRADNGDAEGLPTVLMEAQAAGVPVVTSAHGGVDEGIIAGQTGLPFGERDVGALAAHLSELLTNDSQLVHMAEAGPRFVAAQFDIRRCTAALEASYDAIVDGAA